MTGSESPMDARDKRRAAAAYRAKQRAKRHEERYRYWSCFWTWPFGHLWGGNLRAYWHCDVCGKYSRFAWKRRAE